ncbi:aldo/keto reductase [Alcaligenaceae bacterium]|nr:aldo/keto reductase [Alcaligenaceae bacterium]
MSGNARTLSFHDGRSAPQLGFGVWQVENDITPGVVQKALEHGYRSIDTAAIYGNEEGVGKGIAQAGIDRSELFIATKVWNDKHGHDSTKASFEESLERLGLDYVDLYLIHWPVPKVDKFVDAWECMIQLRDEGRAKSIGVCNFNVNHLEKLLDKTGVLPVVNQIELHPRFQQAALREFHAEHDIITEAWSPLGQNLLWEEPELLRIAKKHGRSVAQVMLRWHVQLGNMVLTKSVTQSRMQENARIFDFVLDDTDMQAIAKLDQPDGRVGPDPDLFRDIKR